jgi:DNA replication and repair protein RecF
MLFGRFGSYKAGLSRSQQKLEIKLDGEPIRRRSTLVSKTPVNIVNADSSNLITGSPEQRRKYLDWCLFHVEHQYSEHWIRFKHALKQRNQLLKSRQDLNLLDYWDGYLIEPSVAISQHRRRYTALIAEQLVGPLTELPGAIPITLDYVAGWPEESDLKQCLEESRDKDIRAGYTNYGIHRDNLQIMADGMPAAQVLSRGQLKRVCLALIVAALNIVREKSNKKLIFLVDDLHSELDEASQQVVYRQLTDIGLQLFVTNLESYIPAALQGKEYKMFHVEHGIIKALKKR